MMKYLAPVLLVALCANVKALSKEERQAKIMEKATGCLAENPLTDDEVAQIKQHQLPNNANAKCFVNCIATSIGIMEKGILNVDAAKSLVEKFVDDAGELSAVKELIDACKGVNDQPVSDGDKGCDRAALLFDCMVKNQTKFNVSM